MIEVVNKKPVPIYEVECCECHSVLRYRASDVSYCHITCPVCNTLLWAVAVCPVTYEEEENNE